jgi:hypothetical protein
MIPVRARHRLHAADIGDNRTAFQRRKNLLRERTHLRERRAKDDKVGVGNRGEQVGRGIIRRAGFFTVLHAGGPPDEAGDFARQPSLAHGQPDGAAEQADADDGDFLKLHGGKLAECRSLINQEIHESHE